MKKFKKCFANLTDVSPTHGTIPLFDSCTACASCTSCTLSSVRRAQDLHWPRGPGNRAWQDSVFSRHSATHATHCNTNVVHWFQRSVKTPALEISKTCLRVDSVNCCVTTSVRSKLAWLYPESQYEVVISLWVCYFVMVC